MGVIASVTAPFCGACDRLWLTADGQLRNCLFSNDEYDLTTLLRGEASVPGQRDDRMRCWCTCNRSRSRAP